MFHLFTVEEETYSVLKRVFSIPEIKENFALAGGTSLSLQLGHRQSIDLDIFSNKPIDTKEIEILLSSNPLIQFSFVNSSRNMLFSYINKIKCDFVYEPAKLIHPFFDQDGVNYFHVEDIAAMKMHTVCGRGKKKDFFDIYVLIETFGWPAMLQFFEKKYGPDQFYFLWKSISYFDDADEDADINGLSPFTKTWEEIKKYILKNCK